MKTTIDRITWILLGGLLLTFSGLHNGYPFVYPDTGSYIFHGFDGAVPPDRPLAYGLFVRHISMMESAFWVIFAQGILTSLFIYWFLGAFVEKVTPRLFIGIILLLLVISDISVYVSYLMPDLFTPLAYGALGLLMFAPLTFRKTLVVSLLALISLMMHNSNQMGAALVAVLALGWRMLPANRASLHWKKGALALGVVLLSWLGGQTIHYAYGGGFTSMNGRHMFMMARLNEMGILKNYLDKACAEGKNYRICAFKDQIPDDFLWNPDSPVNKTGGWEANKDEYNQIIADILTDPFYLKTYLVQTLNGAAAQFVRIEAEHVQPMLQNSMPYEAIKSKFQYERYTYSIGRQNHFNEYLDFKRDAARQELFFLLSLFIGVLLRSASSWKRKVPAAVRHFYAYTLVCLVVNALICSAFSTVVSRYQGRLVWLLFLVSIIAVFYRFKDLRWPEMLRAEQTDPS